MILVGSGRDASAGVSCDCPTGAVGAIEVGWRTLLRRPVTLWLVSSSARRLARLRAVVHALDASVPGEDTPAHRAFASPAALDAALREAAPGAAHGPAPPTPPAVIVAGMDIVDGTYAPPVGLAHASRMSARVHAVGAPIGAWRALLPGVRVVAAGMDGDTSGPSCALRAGADSFAALDEPLEGAIRSLRAALRGALWLPPRHVGRLREGLTGRGAGKAAPGGAGLSVREREVLVLIAFGASQPDIARRLGLSLGTVSTYVQRIYDKLGVRTAPAAVLEGARQGLIPL